MLEGRWDAGPFAPDALAWLQEPDLLTVAALHGQVTATGLALACDLRVAAAGTTLAFGPLPDGSGPLVEMVGLSRATAWCLTGAPVGVEEALAAGLLCAVVPAEELLAATHRLVDQVLRHERAAVVEGKSLLQGAARRTAGEQWKAEDAARARVLQEE